MVASGVFD